jgi:hypothetical protein
MPAYRNTLEAVLNTTEKARRRLARPRASTNIVFSGGADDNTPRLRQSNKHQTCALCRNPRRAVICDVAPDGQQCHLCPMHWRQIVAAEKRQQNRNRFFELFNLRPWVFGLRGVFAAFISLPSWIRAERRFA